MLSEHSVSGGISGRRDRPSPTVWLTIDPDVHTQTRQSCERGGAVLLGDKDL